MDQETRSYANNGKVMLASTVSLFLIVIIIIFFHTFRHSCYRRYRHRHRNDTRADSAIAFNEGLRRSVRRFLLTFTYSSDIYRSLHNCTVCLSEFEDGDRGRILPNCNHAFHAHCIDTWFRSHSNCPLCRTLVQQRTAPLWVAASNTEPGLVGLSSFPAPIACPRKSLDLGGIIIEVEGERQRGPGLDSGHYRVET
ncbi:hypothetical protein RJT34_22783 [Clitoria ternatea]|uniref:RING-type E3 ubiquitin transferase n=1 Tax=Clitoria ternatea TaxID=43366 RepID=A0AAN9IKX8_CLITE